MRISAAALMLCAAPALAQTPLSAIDWLEAQTAVPQTLGPQLNRPQIAMPARPIPALPLTEAPTASSITIPEVEVQPLGAPNPEAVGLLPMQVTGLPLSLWKTSDVPTLIELIAAVDPAVPALSALLHTLLLAEADAPLSSRRGAPLLAARLGRLMAQGVVEPAEALIERAGATTPELFQIWFDLSLLTGHENTPCETLADSPSLSTDLATRVFCTARTGDWIVAATVLDTGEALGTISDRDADLLARFLDPDLAESFTPINPPARPSPLEFRLFQAIGEPLATAPLPRAFATVDLSGDTGWKAQLDAAERLARVGAISENRMLGIYTHRKPAASGGIWDRVKALQEFDSAITGDDASSIGRALEAVWPQMRSAGLLVPFANLYGARLLTYPLSGRALDLARKAALLSPEYESAVATIGTPTDELAFLGAIARGDAPATIPDQPQHQAIAAAFDKALPPAALQTQLDEGRLGEVILRAIALFASGADGNTDDLTDALATLRAVGLEDTARRAALELVILTGEGARR
ncbi:hypothetical protein [Puniceibacterium sediminis]|uniref:Uncharacterized protein n=1 Tax=Puniceibacterium sediminis TaxID=1608407 RepID=A0A238XJD7_9RHOB|nr:hypothetical protein [Puniceibacterium sediminis]SNR59105.1 hypothetical protein SAMN06265370_111149 [Puniceibacterium sediminis]